MERVIVADVTAYMHEKNFITKQQHGFLSGRSTTTNLLESLSDWTLTIDNKQTNTVVYVDFSKAFDTVSHAKLITKLKGYGVYGDLLNIIDDFLTDRQQKTRVERRLSTTQKLTSEVVQGSCLGPLLFLIFVNDLADIFDNDVTPKLYADDLKIYSTILSDLDSIRLQENIDKLAAWADTWQLSISRKKCQVMDISSRRQTYAVTTPYHIASNILPVVNCVTDLGVEVDTKLKFATHINRIVHKALNRSYLLARCFVSHDTQTLVKAFKVYVRPLVEYCSSAWSPHYVKDIKSIESVQRKFTKRLTGLWNVPYAERLKRTGLERLDVRRVRADLLLAYKIIFGLTNVDSAQFFQLSHNVETRGHDYKLYIPAVHTDCRKYFFSNRIINVWNDLPASLDFSSFISFKSSIRRINFDKYCIPLD